MNTRASRPTEGEPTDAMVQAYLDAQRAAVEEADRFGRPNVGGLHTNTVREACRAGLRAALATAASGEPQDRTKPLTGTQIIALRAAVPDGEWASRDEAEFFERGVKAAEKHHGIGKNPQAEKGGEAS